MNDERIVQVAPVLAHGLGGRQDLPIPLSFAVIGAGLAVLVSFVVTAVFWKRSRLSGDTAGRPLPAGIQRVLDSRGTCAALRLIGILGTAFFFAVAALGAPDSLANPAPGIAYVFLWVGLVPLSLMFGPVWKLLNPLRSVHLLMVRLAGIHPEHEFVRLPRWIGYWPAAAGLLVFTWMELVAPAGDQPRVLLTFFGLYGAFHLLAASLFGSQWFDRGDAFEVYSALVGRLAPLGRRADGRFVLRNPFDGLDGVRPEAGLIAVVCVWLGSTAYDGFSRSALWFNLVQSLGEARISSISPVAIQTAGFIAIIALVAAVYVACTVVANRVGKTGERSSAQQFAHSLVPIAIGYTVAHYFSLLVFEGQRTIALASDPFDSGADFIGMAGFLPDYGLVSSAAIATVQVSAVIVGHVFGVVAAHDRAVRVFSRRRAVMSQVPLLVLMVSYTVGGLSLLLAV